MIICSLTALGQNKFAQTGKITFDGVYTNIPETSATLPTTLAEIEVYNKALNQTNGWRMYKGEIVSISSDDIEISEDYEIESPSKLSVVGKVDSTPESGQSTISVNWFALTDDSNQILAIIYSSDNIVCSPSYTTTVKFKFNIVTSFSTVNVISASRNAQTYEVEQNYLNKETTRPQTVNATTTFNNAIYGNGGIITPNISDYPNTLILGGSGNLSVVSIYSNNGLLVQNGISTSGNITASSGTLTANKAVLTECTINGKPPLTPSTMLANVAANVAMLNPGAIALISIQSNLTSLNLSTGSRISSQLLEENDFDDTVIRPVFFQDGEFQRDTSNRFPANYTWCLLSGIKGYGKKIALAALVSESE